MATELVQRLVTERSFDDTGTLREEGHIGLFKPDNADEKHLHDVSGYSPPVVEIAPVAPTGPNPTAPQQIPPDGFQTAGGGYAQPGKVLVAEVTRPAEERMAGISTPEEEGKAVDKLASLMEESKEGKANDLVQGTVAEVTADLGGKTDDELATLRAQEVDNEKPRKGVISAIDAELAKRKEAAIS